MENFNLQETFEHLVITAVSTNTDANDKSIVFEAYSEDKDVIDKFYQFLFEKFLKGNK